MNVDQTFFKFSVSTPILKISNLNAPKIYQQQNFSFPYPIIFYVSTKNISSPKAYHKLIKCCKYFLHNNRILSLHCLSYFDNTWKTCSYIGEKSCHERNGNLCHEWIKIDLQVLFTQKIWITNYLYLTRILPKNVTLLVIPKNIKLCIKNFDIMHQIISVKQLALIGLTLKKCYFYNVTVTNENHQSGEEEASLSKIVESLPVLEEFEFSSRSGSSNITKASIKEILNCQKFLTLKQFYLHNISDDFEIEDFCQFLKSNKTMDIHLHFNYGLSKSYLQRIKILEKKFVKLNTKNYWPPYFFIPKNEERLAPRTALMVEHYIFARNHNPVKSCCCMSDSSYKKMVAFKRKKLSN